MAKNGVLGVFGTCWRLPDAHFFFKAVFCIPTPRGHHFPLWKTSHCPTPPHSPRILQPKWTLAKTIPEDFSRWTSNHQTWPLSVATFGDPTPRGSLSQEPFSHPSGCQTCTSVLGGKGGGKGSVGPLAAGRQRGHGGRRSDGPQLAAAAKAAAEGAGEAARWPGCTDPAAAPPHGHPGVSPRGRPADPPPRMASVASARVIDARIFQAGHWAPWG